RWVVQNGDMAIDTAGEPWSAARTLGDLAAATIEFLVGDLQMTPLHLGPPDTESWALISDLVAMNRAGFITLGSQPGSIDEPTRSAQRAYVVGICNESTAARIENDLLADDLVVIALAPGSDSCSSIVVTVDDGAPFTFLGGWSVGDLDRFRN